MTNLGLISPQIQNHSTEPLEEKGFIKTYPGIPKRFSAVDPKIALGNAVRKQELQLQKLKDDSNNIIKQISGFRDKKQADPIEGIQIIEGYKNYLNLSTTLHSNAKKEWLTISRIPVYKPHLDSYKNCVKRGVKVRILASQIELKPENVKAWKKTKANIRAIDYLQTRFSVIDKTEVVIRFSGQNKYLALWIKNESLAKSMRDYFMQLWKKAVKV